MNIAGVEHIGTIAPKAIATLYRRFEFRSRLEAKWAAFFDLCKWKWSYEPIDLNGWIPDFAIGEYPTLVECKPFFHRHEWQDAISKIALSGHRDDVILLGADPTWKQPEVYEGAPVIGWLAEFELLNNEPSWQVVDLHWGITEGRKSACTGLCALGSHWRNKIQKMDGDGKAQRVYLDSRWYEDGLVARWAEACNVAKWVPTKERK